MGYLDFLYLIRDQIYIFLGLADPPLSTVELDDILSKYILLYEDRDEEIYIIR